MSDPDQTVCTCSGDPGYVDPDCPIHGPESGFAPVTVRYPAEAVRRITEVLEARDLFHRTDDGYDVAGQADEDDARAIVEALQRG